MVLQLDYQATTSVPVEIEGLTPDWVCQKSLAEIEQFPIFHGNRQIPLAEFFRVRGDASDQCLEFTGNLAGVHWIGAGMTSGQIQIAGSGGRHIGSGMKGGEIHVAGNCGESLGAEMHGGLIHVRGHADNLVGAAYRGSTKGMTGGTILVQGNAGHEIGLAMRRGTIAIGGHAGHLLGADLIAGTILVCGDCGIRPGAGMRRGTLCLLGPNPPALLPTFRYGTTFRPQFMPLLLRSLHDSGFRFDLSLMTSELDLYHGDFVALGRGEIFFRHIAGT